MIELLAKLLLKDTSDRKDPAVRRGYGRISCIVGIVLNIILFAGKYMAGMLSRSVAVMADSFNNLSDAGSSVITLVGFQMAGKKADLGASVRTRKGGIPFRAYRVSDDSRHGRRTVTDFRKKDHPPGDGGYQPGGVRGTDRRDLRETLYGFL